MLPVTPLSISSEYPTSNTSKPNQNVLSVLEHSAKIFKSNFGQTLSLSSFENNSIDQYRSHPQVNFLQEYGAELSRFGINSDDATRDGKCFGYIEIGKEKSKDANNKTREKNIFAFEQNCIAFVEKAGANNVGFVTLTNPDCPDWKTASDRFNSFNSNFLSKNPHVKGWLYTKEFQKRGSLHYHFLMDFGQDIKTGVDFHAIAAHDYRSASPFLRSQWKEFREASEKYGFGRSEILPLKHASSKTDKEAGKIVGKYLAKYLKKSFSVVSEFRTEEKSKQIPRKWHGRYIGYSAGAKVWSSNFQKFSNGGIWWRRKVAGFSSVMNDLFGSEKSWEGLQALLSKKWCYLWGDVIARLGNCHEENKEIVLTELMSNKKSKIKLLFRLNILNPNIFKGVVFTMFKSQSTNEEQQQKAA